MQKRKINEAKAGVPKSDASYSISTLHLENVVSAPSIVGGNHLKKKKEKERVRQASNVVVISFSSVAIVTITTIISL